MTQTAIATSLVNLTPHTINLVAADGTVSAIPSTGVARLSTSTVNVGAVGGVPLARTIYGNVSGLPDPQDGVIYLVSAIMRAALPHRLDLASPADFVRDGEGNVIGAKRLDING